MIIRHEQYGEKAIPRTIHLIDTKSTHGRLVFEFENGRRLEVGPDQSQWSQGDNALIIRELDGGILQVEAQASNTILVRVRP